MWTGPPFMGFEQKVFPEETVEALLRKSVGMENCFVMHEMLPLEGYGAYLAEWIEYSGKYGDAITLGNLERFSSQHMLSSLGGRRHKDPGMNGLALYSLCNVGIKNMEMV
ncbi:hypothetical protein NC651_005231 [Populus alba x Populus x berolinensis]|nr:hypothetical protein NC651_005231 [Populus alba x Populus x berolinensis]